MKVVFLDIDGVLNCTEYYARCGYRSPALDPLAIARLNRICHETGAKVVISSSWRGRPDLEPALRERGFSGEIVGQTGWHDGDRPAEIEEWVLAHRGVSRFVILDDEDMRYLNGHLVRTTQETGLTDDRAERAISILNEPDTTIAVTAPDEWTITRGNDVIGHVRRTGDDSFVATRPDGATTAHERPATAVRALLVRS